MRLSRTLRITTAVASLAILAVLVAGCGNSSPTAPSSSAPFSKTDVRVGTGAEAVAGKTITVNYSGWLYDPSKPDQKGLLFDTSLGTTPFEFTLGAGQVIKGWDEGVPGMKVGGLRRLVIPPSLGYGNARTAAIPPNSTLVFDVELVSIK